MMKNYFLVLIFLVIGFTSKAQWLQIGLDIDGEASFDRSGEAVDLSDDGLILAIGARGNDGNGDSAGHVRVFENLDGVWQQLGEDIDGEMELDQSGYSLSLSGDGSRVAIGAYTNNGSGESAGHVRIYENINGLWTQLGEDIDGESEFDQSGIAVSLSTDGSIVAIGANGNSNANGNLAGHVRVFQNINSVWTQIGEDIDGEAENDQFGRALTLSEDGTIVAIGSILNDGGGSGAGSIRVFENVGSNWQQLGGDIDGDGIGDGFGFSVSLSADGSILAGGSVNDAGYTRVFQNLGGVWTQIGQDIDGEAPLDWSGFSVSLSADGSKLAIGARENDGGGNNAGHVRVFQNQDNSWVQVGEDIDGEEVNDWSGFSVKLSLDGSVLAIGVPTNDGNGSISGQVRVYGNETLGISTYLEENILMYPNPANTTVYFRGITHRLMEITVYDTTGKILISSKPLMVNETLDISHLLAGVYFFQCKLDDQIYIKKIIKQ